MPFVKRTIEPIYIRRGALKASDVSLGEEHEIIVNKSLTQVLLQLAQLSTHANEIFAELSLECKDLLDKSQRLKTRIWRLDSKCHSLNVLDTPLPEGTLEQTADDVRTRPTPCCAQETGLFTSITRPPTVQQLYDRADVTPRAVYASLGPAGWKAAKKFCLTPIFIKPSEITITLPNHQKSAYNLKRDRESPLRQPRPRSAAALNFSASNVKPMLPTPEETALNRAKSQPSVLVAIDTTPNAFERFARTRMSLTHLQKGSLSNDDQSITTLRRGDRKRMTISGYNDLRKLSEHSLDTNGSCLLDSGLPSSRAKRSSKPKNPDHYYVEEEITTTLSRGRSKEKKSSIIMKLVQRSKSLPRELERSRTKPIIPLDFHDINPTKSVIVSQPGAMLDDKCEKVYPNFYGAPNTELPSPTLQMKLKKSKSDHQISEDAKRHRTKSQSLLEDTKTAVLGAKRPRSVSAERPTCVVDSTQDTKRCNSLSRTFSEFFRRRVKHSGSQSRDSLNTVLTNQSDSDSTRRQSKRLSQVLTHITLRKRDSKATTSSSGHWSGSERFSVDSEGLLSASSQNRLSKVSADRDSALGADISDRPSTDHDLKISPEELCSLDHSMVFSKADTMSLYSVDQEGFYTTMHADSCLTTGTPHSLDEIFSDTSLVSSSTFNSTKTLGGPECSYTEAAGSSGNLDKAEDLSEHITQKVTASNAINRYSLVMNISCDEEESCSSKRIKNQSSDTTTYETDLDHVLEDLSDTETATPSDTDTVLSLRLAAIADMPHNVSENARLIGAGNSCLPCTEASSQMCSGGVNSLLGMDVKMVTGNISASSAADYSQILVSRSTSPHRVTVISNQQSSVSQCARPLGMGKQTLCNTNTNLDTCPHTPHSEVKKVPVIAPSEATRCPEHARVGTPSVPIMADVRTAKHPEKAVNEAEKSQSINKERAIGDPGSFCESSPKLHSSLPRNFSHNRFSLAPSPQDVSHDSLGSWPRKLNKKPVDECDAMEPSDVIKYAPLLVSSAKESPLNTTVADSLTSGKRHSLSPALCDLGGKGIMISSLIEEARSMSTRGRELPISNGINNPIRRPNGPRPWSSCTSSLTSSHSQALEKSVCDTKTPTLLNESITEEKLFYRQPSYRIACRDSTNPPAVCMSKSTSDNFCPLPKSSACLGAGGPTGALPMHTVVFNGSFPEDLKTPKSLSRAPSYKLAQSRSFDRSARAPSYKKATSPCLIEESVRHDSGIELSSQSSSAASIAASELSPLCDASTSRMSSYRLALEECETTSDFTPQTNATVNSTQTHSSQILNSQIDRSCSPTSRAKLVPGNAKVIPITTNSNRYVGCGTEKAVFPSSFNPGVANQSKFSHMDADVTNGRVAITPPAISARGRPISTFIPDDSDSRCTIPDNTLMIQRYKPSAFTSMELLKSEELAVLSLLDKVKRSTRPLSFVQSDL